MEILLKSVSIRSSFLKLNKLGLLRLTLIFVKRRKIYRVRLDKMPLIVQG